MRLFISILLFSMPGALLASGPAGEFWPEWRGPLRTGVSATANPPLTWSSTNNVRWKVATPGFGTSTPVVWDRKVFLLAAIPVGNPPPQGQQQVHRFDVICYDRNTGKQLWRRTVCEEAPHEGHHRDHGFASASPITDGELLLAYFGSRGLYCLDMDGAIQWSKTLGKMRTRGRFGEGASPALYGNTVVVNWDDETENDFLAAFDKRTGRELWRVKRDEATSWTTPLIVQYNGVSQVIVNAEKRVRSYNLADGSELWQCGGQTANPIPTPVASKDTVYVTSGFRGSAVFAIALGKSGDLTGTDAVRWSRNKKTPYVPSPLLVDDLLYLATGNNPELTCLDATTGAPHFEGERFDGLSGIYASPVSARDRVYILGRNGTCIVLKKGPKPVELARNVLGEKTDASIALAGRDLFIRTHESLYCLSESQ